MNEFENTVDTEVTEESVQDDAALASQSEETESNGVMTIAELLNTDAEASSDSAVEETQDAEVQHEQAKEEKVSGGIKGRLLAENRKGYQAGLTEAQKQWEAKEAEYKATIERLQGYELKERAAQIAKEQNVSEAIAMFLAKNGFGAEGEHHPEPVKTPMRDAETGRFISQKQAESTQKSATDERADFLFEQAKNIQRMNGIDAVEMFANLDAATRNKIANGEMDFYDMVRESSTAAAHKRTPPNIKTNSAGGRVNYKNMSDDDIDRMNDYLMKGGVIDARE